MKVQNQPKLLFHGVDIINVSFEAIGPRQSNSKIKIRCNPSVFYPEEFPKVFKILMDVILEDKNFFVLQLRAIGSFEASAEIDQDMKKMFVNANAPAIMFPYVRAFISILTSNMGNVIGTITIPTQFFKGELKELKI